MSVEDMEANDDRKEEVPIDINDITTEVTPQPPKTSSPTNDSNTNNNISSEINEFVDSSPEIIDRLRQIATTGLVDCDWPQLQALLIDRVQKVLELYIHKSGKNYRDEEYQEPNVEKFELENYRKEILTLVGSFNEAPFTIQRICELLYTPFTYYDKISTFLRGLEKNLRVS